MADAYPPPARYAEQLRGRVERTKTASCNGAAGQQFTFHGAFLVINDLCAANSGGKIALKARTGGPSQQWSINPNGTISDIQTGQKCFRASGGNVVAGGCSGSVSQWTFTPSATTGEGTTPATRPTPVPTTRR
ncbi:RICIN domain-containing protein [Actinoallomurus purpureus]|uniref:ricin-type beta-trefoil lectin domain protein n=1 Tax=Actinoallomurus purpureus TaxID=478114 RepID=UPI0020932D6D|nr:RICIN domain-containing protein [Actinoallomurus purpureus]MCO6003431.1 RICIN domain-containing protein [Actinoallomurus purpureus]